MRPLTHAVVVVPCGRDKLAHPAPSCCIYTGAQHKLSRQAADALGTTTRILSAKYGLLELGTTVAPYDVTWGDPGELPLEALAGQLEALAAAGTRQLVMLTPKAYSGRVRAAVASISDKLAELELIDVLAGTPGIGVQRGILSRIKREGWAAL